jgi:hypothetical protein
MHATASTAGGFVGGFIILLLLGSLWARLLTRRVADPRRRAGAAVLAAWLTAGIVGGFGFARGDALFTADAFVRYLAPALAVAILFYLRLRRRR